MDDRPFYEFDDEELILAEATESALSDSRIPALAQKQTRQDPGFILCNALDIQTFDRIAALAEHTAPFTLLDHAQLVNACTCALDESGRDVFGLSSLFRLETGLLHLDKFTPIARPRSIAGTSLADAVHALLQATPTSSTAIPMGMARRLSSSELIELASLAKEPNQFLAMRRLSLHLLPTLTQRDITADAFKEYTFLLRILINTAEASQQLLPWVELRNISAIDADRAARAVISAVRHELHER